MIYLAWAEQKGHASSLSSSVPTLPEALLINVLSKIRTVWDTGGNVCRGVGTGLAEWRDPQAPSKSSHPLASPSPQHTHQGWSPAAPLLAVSLQPRRWRSTG